MADDAPPGEAAAAPSLAEGSEVDAKPEAGATATVPASAAATSNRTKEQLSKMMDGLSDFEGIMRDATRQRRELDEQKLAQLKREIGTLEKGFTSEVLRREEIAKSLHTWAASQIAELKTHLEALLEDRKDALQANIDALNARVGQLEERFQADKEETLKDIAERNAELTRKLEEFQELFEAERQDRLVREARIQDNLSTHEYDTFRRFDEERDVREKVHLAIKERLDATIVSRAKGDEKFQAFVAAELADIKNAIRKEEEIREKEDDEVVASMNRYTQKLQASLHIINSADVDDDDDDDD